MLAQTSSRGGLVLIVRKKFFILSLILFLIVYFLNLSFPHDMPLGEALISNLGLTARSSTGIHYLGILLLVLFASSLFFLSNSLKKYEIRFILLTIVILIFTPPFFIHAFQRTMATGIYALDYEKERSKCEFEMLDKTHLSGKCELFFVNYSSDPVTYQLTFTEPPFDRPPMVSLMNNRAPYSITLQGNEERWVDLEAEIDTSRMKEYIESGEANGVGIIVKDGDQYREL